MRLSCATQEPFQIQISCSSSRRGAAAPWLQPISPWAAPPACWEVGHRGTGMALRERGGEARRDRACRLARCHRRLSPESPSSHFCAAPGVGVGSALGLTYFGLTHISWREAQIQVCLWANTNYSRAGRGLGENELGRDISLPFPNLPLRLDSD